MIFLLIISLFISNNESSSIDSLIRAGDKAYLETSNTKTSDAYKFYHMAKTESVLQNDSSSYFISQYKILRLLGSNNSHYEECHEIIEDLYLFARDKADSLTIDVEYKRLIIQEHYTYQNYSDLFISDWSDKIYECSKLKNLELEYEFRLLYAVYLFLTDKKPKLAKKQYEIIIESLRNKNLSAELKNIFFVASMNIGKIQESITNCGDALPYYHEAIKLEAPKKNYHNLSLLYDWMHTCFYQTGQVDSAFSFLQRKHELFVSSEELRHDASISEIQEKYKNEQLTTELLEQKLSNNEIRTWTISLGSIASLLALSLFIYRQRSRSQLQHKEKQAQLDAINARLDGEQEERKRVASALHDEIASHLSAAAIHLTILQSDNTESSIKARQLISEASQRTRQLSHELYPPVLLQQGLVPALSSFSQQVRSEALDIQFSSEEVEVAFSQEVEAKIYYTTIELIQNIVKHSRATRAKITATADDTSLKILLEDNGIGFDPANLKQGLGLSSVKARIEDLNGQITIISQPDQGTRIDVLIPLAA